MTKTNKIRALFFDIDGTLVSFRTHRIPESTLYALHEARNRGISLFIATGRPRIIINNLGGLQFDGYITMNGACCFLGQFEEVIYRNNIPHEDVQTALKQVDEHRLTAIFVTQDNMHMINPSPASERFARDLNIDAVPTCTADTLPNEDIFQISPFITTEQEPAFMQNLQHCESNRWHSLFTDVVAKGNGKQRGVDEIIARLGIDLSETMAFGDGGNDIGMLKHVGIGVAMGNASDAVKKEADLVTHPVDSDGIWHALKHYHIL